MSETAAGSPYTPPLPPRLPLRLVYTQNYLNVFECTQPNLILCYRKRLNFFLCSLGGGLGPLWLRPCLPLQLLSEFNSEQNYENRSAVDEFIQKNKSGPKLLETWVSGGVSEPSCTIHRASSEGPWEIHPKLWLAGHASKVERSLS